MKYLFPACLVAFVIGGCQPAASSFSVNNEEHRDLVSGSIEVLQAVTFSYGHPPYSDRCVEGLQVEIYEPGGLEEAGETEGHPGKYDRDTRVVYAEVGTGVPDDILIHELFHDYEAHCLRMDDWTFEYAKRFGGHYVFSEHGFILVQASVELYRERFE